jgi:thiamine-phosphate pyrophosphorylase
VRLPPLYAIVDPLDTGRDPVALGEAMLRGGARLLQLRLKGAAPAELYAVARRLRDATTVAGALLIVNDRPDVAAAVGADGVHLGQDDLPPDAARRALPPGSVVGVSTHDPREIAAGIAGAPDYLAVGPVYETDSKARALPARGLDIVRHARRRWPGPLVAIGGITAERAAAVRDAGADSVAMIGALVRAPDVAAAVRAVSDALASS